MDIEGSYTDELIGERSMLWLFNEQRTGEMEDRSLENQASLVLLLEKQLFNTASNFPTGCVWLETKD